MQLVLDEADQMLEIGFPPSIEAILGTSPRVALLHALADCCAHWLGMIPNARQTLLFSATVSNEVKAVAGMALKKCALATCSV